MSRATGCADDPAMLLKVKDALIQTTRKARFCKAQFAAVAVKHASKGCLFGVYTMRAVRYQQPPTRSYVLVVLDERTVRRQAHQMASEDLCGEVVVDVVVAGRHVNVAPITLRCAF